VRVRRRRHLQRDRCPGPSRFHSGQDINDLENDHDDRSDDAETRDNESRFGDRSPDIHWPEGFSPDQADLFSHNELRIDASCERVWKHIVEATKWPQWYPNSKDVQIIGGGDKLNAGSVFRWTTFGLPLESRINEFTPYSRIGWYGYAPGEKPSFYHTWYLEQAGDGCRVVTDEVGMGSSAAYLRESDESLMHRGHDLWLATLKWMAEGE
jgi:uncharacterized protein YndB with AHSA1/START domain